MNREQAWELMAQLCAQTRATVAEHQQLQKALMLLKPIVEEPGKKDKE